MANGHGGARVGSGRKPKALRFRAAVGLAEAEIAKNLPSIARRLVHAATVEGDLNAAKYCMDRILGRPALTLEVPSEDLRYPPVPIATVLHALKDVLIAGGPDFTDAFLRVVKGMSDGDEQIHLSPVQLPAEDGAHRKIANGVASDD